MNKRWLLVLVPVLFTWYFTRSYYHAYYSAPLGFVKDSVRVVFDTVPYFDTTKPKLVFADPVLVPADVDTSAVLKDYFTRKKLRDSLQVNDVRIKVDYSLFANNLEAANWQVVNLRPVEQHFFSSKIKMNSLAGGILMGRNLAAPVLSYSYKDIEMQLGYNLVQNDVGPLWVVGFRYRVLSW